MVVFPNCKINIGLNILGKRADGYHDLQTVFLPVAITDVLEIIEDKEAQNVRYTSSGIHVPGNPENNLCVRAYQLLKKDYPSLPSIAMHLHKNVPMGAGLGGGSADAAFALRLLNTKFDLNIATEKLLAYALQLGSDCPLFISNTVSFASGRGENLEPISLELSAYKIYVVNPGIHISTSLAFSRVSICSHPPDLANLVTAPVAEWKTEIVNDFEKPVFAVYPEIAAVKQRLYDHGAAYASMSGSGSTVYGIFKKSETPAFNFPAHYFQRWA